VTMLMIAMETISYANEVCIMYNEDDDNGK